MEKRKISEEVLSDGRILVTEVFYTKGGYNWATGKLEERGYYLSLRPVERKTENGITIETYAGFSGIKAFLQAARRFSERALREVLVPPDTLARIRATFGS